MKQEHEQTLHLLQKKMDKLKQEAKKKDEDKDNKEKEVLSAVNSVKTENILIKETVKNVTDELTMYQSFCCRVTIFSAKKLLEERKKEMIDIQVNNRVEGKKAKDVIFRQVLFDDTLSPELNALNIPTTDLSISVRPIHGFLPFLVKD